MKYVTFLNDLRFSDNVFGSTEEQVQPPSADDEPVKAQFLF